MKRFIEYQLANRQLTLPILTYPVITKLGVSLKKFLTDSALMAEGIRMMSALPTSAALSYMDLSVEAEAFGAPIKFPDNEVPTVAAPIITAISDTGKISIPKIGAGRTGLNLEAFGKARRLIPDKALFAGVIGPYSLAGRLCDMTELMVNCYEDPENTHKLLRTVSAFIASYIKAFKAQGAEGVIMAEPAAGLLSPALADEFSSRYVKEIIKDVSDGEFIFIYHNCGNVLPLYKSLTGLGADAYHFGNAIDIKKMLELMPADKIVLGNLNPLMLRDSSSAEIKAGALELLKNCSVHKNYVLSTGCDVPAAAKWENIDAYFNAVKEYFR